MRLVSWGAAPKDKEQDEAGTIQVNVPTHTHKQIHDEKKERQQQQQLLNNGWLLSE